MWSHVEGGHFEHARANQLAHNLPQKQAPMLKPWAQFYIDEAQHLCTHNYQCPIMNETNSNRVA